MAKTKEGIPSETTPEDLVADEIVSNEDVAELDIYAKSAEEANADENVLKDIQADESKDEADAETEANDELGPEVTGAKPTLTSASSSETPQPSNVLERQEKAVEGQNFAQPALSEIEEETVVAEEIKSRKKKK